MRGAAILREWSNARRLEAEQKLYRSLRDRYEIVVETSQHSPASGSRPSLSCLFCLACWPRSLRARTNSSRAIWNCGKPLRIPTIYFLRFRPGGKTCGWRFSQAAGRHARRWSAPRGSFGEGAFAERRTIRRDGGLTGQAVSIQGLSSTSMDVLVRVESLGGAIQTERLHLQGQRSLFRERQAKS